jgi:hypothetical protein
LWNKCKIPCCRPCDSIHKSHSSHMSHM